MQSSIDRYLRESNYEHSILNSRIFKGSRDVLEGKALLLRDKGLGRKPNKTNSLTPKSIIATLWWQLTQHFGLWGRQEQHSMRVEGFFFRKDETGASYIVYKVAYTKKVGYNYQKCLKHKLKGVL